MSASDRRGAADRSEALERVRQVVAEWLAADVFPDPWDLDLLCRRVGDWRGRRLHLANATDFGWPGHLVIIGQHVDMLIHDDRATGLYARHGDLHELGHLALGHDGVRLDPEIAGHGDVLHALTGRTGYADAEEREAELFATLLGLELHNAR